MSTEGVKDSDLTLQPWDYERHVRRVDAWEAHLSRGYLRSRPEKWFPGFATAWLPLAHSLGADLKILEVKPLLSAPSGMQVAFAGTVDDEPIGVCADSDSSRVILDAVCPGANAQAREVVSEYLARRFIASLAMAWSGPESSVVMFDADIDARAIREAGAIKLTVQVNGNRCTIWVLLGRILVERLDGLWRRQIHSTSNQSERDLDVHLEVAQLAVPPSMLSDYLKAGSVVDLEIPHSDRIVLKTNGKAWMPARLCNVDGKIGFEINSGPTSGLNVPDGTTRLAVEFGTCTLSAANVAELSQEGAIWTLDSALSDKVQMVINNEKVGDATLRLYEGRFAIDVL